MPKDKSFSCLGSALCVCVYAVKIAALTLFLFVFMASTQRVKAQESVRRATSFGVARSATVWDQVRGRPPTSAIRPLLIPTFARPGGGSVPPYIVPFLIMTSKERAMDFTRYEVTPRSGIVTVITSQCAVKKLALGFKVAHVKLKKANPWIWTH